MYGRIASIIVLLLVALTLSECACPPGYHPGRYGRRCWPNDGPYYPPPPGYGPPPGYPPGPPPGYPPPPGYGLPPGYPPPPGYGPPPENAPPPGYPPRGHRRQKQRNRAPHRHEQEAALEEFRPLSGVPAWDVIIRCVSLSEPSARAPTRLMGALFGGKSQGKEPGIRSPLVCVVAVP
jgi:hypothetical protein